MDLKISPRKLNGKIAAITSKSDAHRCLICAALCDEPTEVKICDTNRDIEATIECLEALGAKIIACENDIFKVEGIKIVPRAAKLNCCESGSTLRFILPLAAHFDSDICLFGEGRLPQRPLSPLKEQLEAHGCKFSNDKLPFSVSGKIVPGKFELPGNVSSQYITGLLLALPLLEGDSEIALTSPLQSAGYVDMTIRTLSLFGIDIEIFPNGLGYKIKGKQKYRSPKRITVEGDWSNAAFWLSAGAIGEQIQMSGLDFNSVQGDKMIAELLKSFGAAVTQSNDVCLVSPADMRPIEIDAALIPDLVPILSVAACKANGVTKIKNAERLRIKESDRLKTVFEMITNLGGDITELSDGLIINGTGSLKGGRVDSFNDHRIAMSAAIASIICERDVIITGAQAVEKSYPKFFEDMAALGGVISVI